MKGGRKARILGHNIDDFVSKKTDSIFANEAQLHANRLTVGTIWKSLFRRFHYKPKIFSNNREFPSFFNQDY